MPHTKDSNPRFRITNECIALLIGACLGLIASSIYFYASNNADIAAGTIANSIIALCTFTALIISYFSIKSQKENRRWEVNKDLLIRLSTSLAETIVQTENFISNEIDNMQGIQNHENFVWDDSISEKFNKSLTQTVHVYSQLLNKEIIEAVKNYQKRDQEIARSFDDGEFDVIEAHDSSLEAQIKLMAILNKNIKTYAAL
ncbi:hypothetical protein [Comamonas sp. A7-5]|uniref:hypothetical protein n=1 Tax=Comamonas sp. A7-5 TaxID=673549 RepID=UPI0031DFAFE2